MSYTKIHNPPNEAPLQKIWVWVSVDDNGNEGIVATGIEDVRTGGIQHFPLVTGKASRVPEFDRLAEKISKEGGKKVVKAEFVRVRN